MEPTRELIDDLYRERVLRARRMPIGAKVLAGPELFEGACLRMAAGVRADGSLADGAGTGAFPRGRIGRPGREKAPAPLNEAFLTAIDAVSDCGLPYLLVGSYCGNFYGIERCTLVVDFVIAPGDASIGELQRRLGPAIHLDRRMRSMNLAETGRVVGRVADSPIELELFFLGADLHDQEQFRRRRVVEFLARKISLPTPEDVIITKLRWALLGNRSKDRDDARDVIAVQDTEGRLDWDYIHSWCDRHGTRALLDEVRRSIPPL